MEMGGLQMPRQSCGAVRPQSASSHPTPSKDLVYKVSAASIFPLHSNSTIFCLSSSTFHLLSSRLILFTMMTQSASATPSYDFMRSDVPAEDKIIMYSATLYEYTRECVPHPPFSGFVHRFRPSHSRPRLIGSGCKLANRQSETQQAG